LLLRKKQKQHFLIFVAPLEPSCLDFHKEPEKQLLPLPLRINTKVIVRNKLKMWRRKCGGKIDASQLARTESPTHTEGRVFVVFVKT
jgi:hypothetical protein